MRKLIAVCPLFLPFAAGCLASAGDAIAPGAMVGVNWETALTFYGPMGGIIVWFMYREKKRDERLFALVEKCTDVIAKVEDALAKTSADNEKQRNALYRLAEEVHDFSGARGGVKTKHEV